jgi:hypothetical protein
MRTIGPEPYGATPLEAEDLEGLIPDFVATRADLNQVEFENIIKALPCTMPLEATTGVEPVFSSNLKSLRPGQPGKVREFLRPAPRSGFFGRLELRSLRQAPNRLWTTRSISLMPMNGAMIPPRP